MAGGKSENRDNQPFIAELRPHRSLGPSGFLILMSFVSLVAFVAGMVFLRAGAWPVLGFFGLDVAAIYIAFRINYRAGRLYERIELDREALTVTRIFPSGRRKSWSFNPYWVRFQFLDPRSHVPGSEMLPRPELKLSSHGRHLVFGHFLNDEEKIEFGQVLARAIRSLRR